MRTTTLAIVLASLVAGAALPVLAQGVREADRQYAVAMQLYRVEDYAGAASEFEKFLVAWPADVRLGLAYSFLGSSYQLQGRTDLMDRALAAYAQAIVKSPGPDAARLRAEANFHSGECYARLKQYARAAESYAKCLAELGPKPTGDENVDLAVRTQYWLAESRYQDGKADQALRDYRAVLDLAPKHSLAPWALYSIGMVELQRKRYAEAMTHMEAVLAGYPASDVLPQARLALGYACIGRASARPDAEKAERERERRRAADLFTSVIDDPASSKDDRLMAYISRGQAFYDLGQFDRSEVSFSKALELVADKNSERALDLHFWRAHSLYSADRFAESAAEYATVAAARDRLPTRGLDSLYWAGTSWYLHAKRAKGGVDAYRKAIAALADYLTVGGDADPRSPAVALTVAFAHEDLIALGAPTARSDARAAFKAIIDRWPASPEAGQAHAGIVRLTASTMDLAELEAWHRDSLPGLAGWSIALQLSRKYFLLERFADGIPPAKGVLDARASGDVAAQAAYLVGACYQRLNRGAEAVPYYQQVAGLKPAEDLARLAQRALVQVYLDGKRYPEARDTALALTKRRFTDRDQEAEANMYLAEAYLNAGQSPEALSAYQRVVKEFPASPLVPSALLAIGWIAEDVARPDRALAVETYRTLIAKYGAARPDLLPEANFRLGVNLAELRQYPDAIAAFRNVPEAGRFGDQAAYGVAWALRDSGENDPANAAFKALSERFPTSPLAADSLYRVGDYWFKQENYTAALPLLRAAFEKAAPDNRLRSTFAYKYAQTAWQLSMYREASEAFARAAEDPEFECSAEGLFWRASSLEKLAGADNLKLARTLYRQYGEKYPRGERLLDAALGTGRSALRAGLPADARTDLAACLALTVNPEVIRISPEMPRRADEIGAEAQYFIAESYFLEKNYPEAHRQYAAVSAYNYEPWYSRSLLSMAKCSVVQDEKHKGEVTLKRLVSLFPADNPTVVEALAYAREQGLDVPARP